MENASRCANRLALSLFFFLALAVYALSDVHWDTPAGKSSPFFSFVVTSASGAEMYAAYCAGCHGKDGRARTPTARICTVAPADLTLLAINNRGTYPAHRVAEILRYGTGRPPSGQGYMPVWEPLLRSMNSETPDATELRIYNLTEYVRALQARPAIHP